MTHVFVIMATGRPGLTTEITVYKPFTSKNEAKAAAKKLNEHGLADASFINHVKAKSV